MRQPTTPQIDVITIVQRIVQALEQRFTDYNGPFEYGTRLAEETGELIEAAYAVKDSRMSEQQQAHLLKEMQDVLRVTVGVATIYNLADTLPKTLDQLASATTDTHDIVSYVVRLGVASGELASTINHAEGTGIKRQKHGDDAASRVTEKATNVASIVAQIARHLRIEAIFEASIAVSDAHHRTESSLQPPPK